MVIYEPNDTLAGHDGSIRAICNTNDGCIVTGAMDSFVKIWKPNNTQDHVYKDTEVQIFDHGHWITALLSLPQGVVPECPNGGFITGCMDKLIRIYSSECQLVRVLSGHTGGVISLGWGSSGDLLSGSWDETARIWNILNGNCKAVLEGHENGVCVLGMKNGEIITGSTGRQVGNSVADFRIRIWKDGRIVKTINDHNGPVRRLVATPCGGFISCSNDGSLKYRSENGEVITTMNHPLNSEGKPGFILGCDVLPSGEFLSASEDCTVRVWAQSGALLQTIDHPAGLWCVHTLPNGDIVTGCDDKIARVFTRDSDRVSDVAKVAFEESLNEALNMRKKRDENIDVSKLPLWADRESIQGKSEGDIRMFQKNGTAWACQWSQEACIWIEIGEVTGTGSGGVIDGVSYDLVLPVEIEQMGTGAVQTFQLGYNQGDNPFMVAQEFINKNMLDQNYLQQIANYIIERTKDVKPSYQASDEFNSSMNTTKNIPASYTYLSKCSFHVFDSMKVSKLIDTVKRFNTQMDTSYYKLNDLDFNHLEEIIKIIQQTAFYHASVFTTGQIRLIQNLLQWPVQFVFPVMDLIRLMVTHPNGAVQLASGENGSILVKRLTEYGSVSSNDKIPTAVRMLPIRIFANMLTKEESRDAVISNQDIIIESLPKIMAYDHKLVRSSLSGLITNLTLSSDSISENNLNAIVNMIKMLLMNPNTEDEVVMKSMVSLGIIILKNENIKSSQCDLLSLISQKKQNNELEYKIQDCAAEVLQVLNRNT